MWIEYCILCPKVFLKQALELAKIRRGFCAPNPGVGAILVKENRIISTGFHRKSGLPHAEVEAIMAAGKDVEGSDLYVTLEPCCHYGKTPPCTELIIKSGIKAVYYGFTDPNPNVPNQGSQILKKAGIDCFLVEIPDIRSFYESYSYWTVTKRPWVTIKIAISFDGKIAGIKGSPVALTGEELNFYTHEFRKKSDALLTTINTILKDDPQLNVRLGSEIVKKPIYILDSNLRLPLNARVHKTGEKVVLFYKEPADVKRKRALTEKNVCCIEVAATEEGLDLDKVLDTIGADGVHDLWVEAGPKCFEAFLYKKLLHRALIYVVPKVVGKQAIPGFHIPFNFKEYKIRWCQVGKDVVCDVSF